MSPHRQLTVAQHVLLIGLTIFLTMLAVPAVAYAGNGTFRNGEFNFCVSVRFNATDAQLQQIRTAFQNGSQILSDATDGQHRFGEIAIVNNSGASESADYWVNAGSGRAYATFGQYGVRGEHVMLYFDSNFQAVNGADGDAYTVAHEHAHHAYAVADEYSGPLFLGIGSTAAECALTPDTAALSFCLMDNYFTRGGRFFGLATPSTSSALRATTIQMTTRSKNPETMSRVGKRLRVTRNEAPPRRPACRSMLLPRLARSISRTASPDCASCWYWTAQAAWPPNND